MVFTRLLVSACLLGQKVRYNGSDKRLGDRLLALWQQQGRIVPICPEVAAGLPTPRPPAEIRPSDGRIFDDTGAEVTDIFETGAQIALTVAQREGCRFALLTDGSPSCGARFIYDGSFSGTRIPGAGRTVALLRRHGIAVYTPSDIHSLSMALEREDRSA
ncbi:purine nucleoside phosphorylase [Elstera litoralis]|uniref:Purine nucleoside phosphorylase n=1 Tax=Elstera litoralis TaxID=552518 RepID=A0A0F3IWW9_9PROT|nr:DUF523 domain-containing protein [Elstera litoralis]KJV11043.1 purine nucleoside phosphorylase [Elstera litoralis]